MDWHFLFDMCSTNPPPLSFPSATDGGVPKRQGFANLTVNVANQNDQAPVFEQNAYSEVIGEDRSPGALFTIKASNPDETISSTIIYTFDAQGAGSVFSMQTGLDNAVVSIKVGIFISTAMMGCTFGCLVVEFELL